MNTTNFTFLSNDGKTAVHAVKWMPEDGNIKAILQITHGMVEFIDRYDNFARFLCSKGIAVVGNDHHRDPFRLQCSDPRFQCIVRPADRLWCQRIVQITEQQRDPPLFQPCGRQLGISIQNHVGNQRKRHKQFLVFIE